MVNCQSSFIKGFACNSGKFSNNCQILIYQWFCMHFRSSPTLVTQISCNLAFYMDFPLYSTIVPPALALYCWNRETGPQRFCPTNVGKHWCFTGRSGNFLKLFNLLTNAHSNGIRFQMQLRKFEKLIHNKDLCSP